MAIDVSPLLINILTILFLAVLLVKSADFVSEAFIYIANKAGIGEFIVGFLVLAFVTSLPEISVAINSVNSGVEDLAIGNLLGGSLVLISLVTGLSAITNKGIKFHGKFKPPEIVATLITIALPVIVLIDQNLSASEGLILLLAYCGLAYQLYRVFQRKGPGRPPKPKTVRLNNISSVLVKTSIGIAGLVFISDMIVDTAVNTATLLNVNVALVGVIVLAIGTNLPELTILLRANANASEKFAVGDFLGSASINTAIIGAIGIVSPHVIENFSSIIPVLILLSFAIFLFFLFERTKSEISRQEGILLIAVYLSMIILELLYLLVIGF